MANKECEKTRTLIPLYIDSMLSDKETDEVIKHLGRCPDCRNEYNYLKAIIGTTREIPEKELPKDFHKNLMEKIELSAHNKKKRYITLRHISAGVAAAAVVAISFVALGEVGEPKKMELSDEYITSRLSDEPIQKDADDDMSTDHSFTEREKNISRAENKVKDVTTEEKTQTAEQIPVSINLDEEMQAYTTATVTLTEDNRDEVLKILSVFEKDQTGYIVEDIEELIEKLKELGASITTVNNDADRQNYVVIK